MKTVAILGGGPAGASQRNVWRSAGLRAIVFDEKLAWEKPCGGGLTYKAYQQYPFLIDNDTPKKLVHETMLAAPKAGEVKMPLDAAAGDLFAPRPEPHAAGPRRKSRGARSRRRACWVSSAASAAGGCGRKRGIAEADFCIVATGARNPLRDVGTEWSAQDTMSALGYYVPASQDHIDIQFLPQLEGYIWVFPRCGHLSVGICGKGEPAQALRVRLEALHGRARHRLARAAVLQPHAAVARNAGAGRTNRVAGEGWMAVGDAAGRWIRSRAKVCTTRCGRAIWRRRWCWTTRTESGGKGRGVSRLLRARFRGGSGVRGDAGARGCFWARFMFNSVPARMVQFMRRSPRFRDLMQDLFAGTQPYRRTARAACCGT